MTKEESPLSAQGLTRPANRAGGGVDLIRLILIIAVALLSLVSVLMFLQLQSVKSQVQHEQDEIDQLENELGTEQKGEIQELHKQVEREHSFGLYQMAGTFTLLASIITMFHMTAHLRNFNEPFVQRKILAILWMCPIYGVTSLLSLVFPVLEGYLRIIKDFYEAYVIYQFLSFLIAVLGKGDRDVVVGVLARHADHLAPPTRLLRCFYHPDPQESDEAKSNAVLLECQIMAMQFVLFRPVTSIALFVLDMAGDHNIEEEEQSIWTFCSSPWFYIVFIQNLSVCFAFSGLMKFYHAVHEDLAWCRPFAKFLCIKGVVFMTFWQGLVLSIIATATADGGNTDEDNASSGDWAASVQNLLICLEMLLFSIAHFCVFPTEEWEPGYRRHRAIEKFGDSIGLGDFVSDVNMIVRSGRASRASRQEGGYSTVQSGRATVSTDGEESEQSLSEVPGDPDRSPLAEDV